MSLPIFAGTLFISAFVLFLVQPIVGKMILPKLGGTPQVWNTCMVFFQTALLAGYAYTHTVSTRLQLRPQLITHMCLLLVALVVMFGTTMGPPQNEGYDVPTHPISMETWHQKVLGANPIPDALTLLAKLVGLPFLVIATSAPLLQKWFVHTGHPAAKDPYFLYGASNLGSLMALLLYPIAVEPWLRLGEQAWLFSLGYCVLVVAVLGCIAVVFKLAPESALRTPASEPVPGPMAADPAGAPVTLPPETSTATTATPPALAPAPEAPKTSGIKKGAPKQFGRHAPKTAAAATPDIQRDTGEVTPMRRLRWIALAAVPSSFMLGITSHITTDLSPVPLFWLVPLTLYLLSFILVYMRWPIVWSGEPHRMVLYAQPVILAFMIWGEIKGWASDPRDLWLLVFANVAAFFATALMCHGELAKDRPDTRHLTEYYLLMSVGGMVGGMFNGLVAPIFFFGLAEFPIAMVLACLVRPLMGDGESWTQKAMGGFLETPAQPLHKGPKGSAGHHPHAHQPHEGPVSYDGLLDWALPIVWIIYLAMGARYMGRASTDIFYYGVYFVPLAICCLYYARPLRLALTVGAVLLVNSITTIINDSSVLSDRSYFGIIRVKESGQTINGIPQTFRQLVHGHINHGMNFQLPEISKDKKKELKREEWDLTRLATTYYHRFGPAGVVMEKFNWFPGPQNTFRADARMPASLAGLAVADLVGGLMPTTSLVGMWSEPPFATIGLGTGTMASYARAFQHCHYYEIDNHIRRLSLPQTGQTMWFNYLQFAKDRGAEVEVLMGDARLRMAMPYKSLHVDPDKGGGPDNFYHMMVVDAFSSDAIPAHLITKQAIQMYFTKLTEEGILCVHTSNRFVNLPKVVAAVSRDLGLSYLRGRDNFERDKGNQGDIENLGHFTSEWVMVARKPEYLTKLNEITKELTKNNPNQVDEYWSTTPRAESRYLWTDDHYNLITVLRLFDKPGER